MLFSKKNDFLSSRVLLSIHRNAVITLGVCLAACACGDTKIVAQPTTTTLAAPTPTPAHEIAPPAGTPAANLATTASSTAKASVTANAKPSEDGKKEKSSDSTTSSSDEALVRTRHTAQLATQTLEYTVSSGYLPLKSETGDVEAKIFHMFYAAGAKPEGDTTRPLVFLFNGGPGSSSIWLHMGAYGPKRAKLRDDGTLYPPPYEMVENEASLLPYADLVFVDPVGTGFSRPAKPDQGKKYWGVQQDLSSLGEFIRLFLVKNGRLRSPLFLAGESYGTFRVAGLANHLLDKNIALNGLILISTILDFRPSNPTKGNDLPYAIHLPTLTAAAWYHKLLPVELQSLSLREVLNRAEEYAMTTYTLALLQGDKLQGKAREQIVKDLSRFTSLSEQFIDYCNLRVDDWRFRKELLRSRKRSLSVYDARLLAIEPKAIGDGPDFDPILSAMGAPYTMLFNDYVRNVLDYKTDMEYITLSGTANGSWDYGDPRSSDLMDMSEPLRKAMARNVAMRTLVARGLYDFATPYFAANHTFTHMGLDEEVKGNVTVTDYEAGHMMYIEKNCRKKLTDDTVRFIQSALPENR